MRFRGKSIRRKIVALLLVPLLSLTAIWAFATVITGRQALSLVDSVNVVDKLAYPIEDTARVIQQERRQTLVYLADPRASDAMSALRRSRTATDGMIDKIRANAQDPDVRDGVSGESRKRLNELVEAFDSIDPLRRGVEEGTITRAGALKMYTKLIDPYFDLLSTLNGFSGLDDMKYDQQGRALVGATRARELLSREDALIGSALVAGRITKAEIRQATELRAQRGLLFEVNFAQLPEDDRARYERYWNGTETTQLRKAEQAIIEGGAGTPRVVTASHWDQAAGRVLKQLSESNMEATDRFQDRVEPAAVGVIVRVIAAGVLGLLALLVSLFLSVRIGRSLIRDLRRLRLEAHEASGVRLPGVLRRLAAGEQVDVETEAPRLTYGKDEIGQVGQALNTLQRAAVEATVKQADLRRGVSEVFVNLARRSQVLLHKQLTLLDTMERRTEDTDELADLFRLDHLTTRMRRHAEGLVILSGAAPSRQWRKPVQLMDVVRAAVAEVEDYERIEVRRLPRIAVTGPAVADLTHLMAELLENATVFSPPHTAVQVLGEHVANGFTLEIHDRGLGMTPDALLDANLRLAETPEFELSDTDRLGLFVVSRLAQRQRVRVSLQPSPYGGTTAVVFIPESLLTDDVPDTDGAGFRIDRAQTKDAVSGADQGVDRAAALAQVPVQLPGLPASVLDGPVELEAPVGMADLDGFPGSLDDEDSERGGLFRPRRRVAGTPGEQHQQARDDREAGRAEPTRRDTAPTDDDATEDAHSGGPVPLPRRRTPKLVRSNGRPVTHARPQDSRFPDDRPQESRFSGGKAQESRPSEDTRFPADSRFRTDDRPQTDSRFPTDGRLPRERRFQEDRSSESRPLDPAAEDGTPSPQGPRQQSSWPDLSPPHRDVTAVEDVPTDLPARGRRAATDSRAGGRTTTTTVGGLPRRVRQANLAPQLKDGPDHRPARAETRPEERDAEEVRSRMASLQRGWQRGRDENAAGDDATNGTAPGTTPEGDGR
ncbi:MULTISPECIES: nitrate- and nitrite sensing domain-containing protein [unclassified Streptomyces]|uniref:sensor histidine kinase n=1 Tax=unclassified Streptomyces TaxID=2593676 RepID=UPI00136B157C|nr:MULTISPECIES: nitrate- and nitrite sensing domain-containing protein [unclassified Streptomyces]MYY85110.1 histidine kinase [Streptomyces sp. SID335]MYZ19258.1 histidine kinase [Streptomyces sp. SID337]NEB42913.1 histidine kinase [Streptomyces sp. SID339]